MSIQLTIIRQAGSSLVEVMVSLLVLSIGLMGVMSMQSNGFNSNQRATFLSEAHVAAHDMVDRMLAFENLNADVSLDEASYDGIDTRSVTESSCSTSEAGCSWENTPAADAYQWQQLFESGQDGALSLPGGYGKVEWNEVAAAYFVTVYWDQDRMGGELAEFQSEEAPRNCNTSNKESYLTCFRLAVRF